ncbi:MAG: SCP2 sterol-binding domain-containing protein [Candidatus Helarchaeota archaeon]
MEESERQNLKEMFLNTITDLIEEKKNSPKHNKKLKSLNVDINLILENVDIFTIKFRNGDYKIESGVKSDVAKLEIKSNFENFFKYSSREIGDFKALLTGKLKVKGKRRLFLLLKVGTILKIIPEKNLEK